MLLLRTVLLLFLTQISSTASIQLGVQLSEESRNLYEDFSKRISSLITNRRLEDESFCVPFEDELKLNDPILQDLDCTCSEDSTTFSIFCALRNKCFRHTKGQMSAYTGNLSFELAGDFSDLDNPMLSDSLCFFYNEARFTGCLNNAIFSPECFVTVGGEPSSCSSCTVCAPGKVSIDCGQLGKADECAGDTLEGTPLQFYSVDAIPCDDEIDSSGRGYTFGWTITGTTIIMIFTFMAII